MATATLTEEKLIAERDKLDAQLAEIESRKVLEHRRGLVRELATCTLPASVGQNVARLLAARDKAEKEFDLAKSAYKAANDSQAYQAQVFTERSTALRRELIETADPAIDSAAASLLKLAKESGVREAVPRVQPIVNELAQFKFLALPTQELHRQIANITRKAEGVIR